MTNDNKPPMFGPSGVFDPATYEPRSGKTFWMAATDVSSLADKEAAADTLIGNCTTSIPFKFDFDSKDSGHTTLFAPTRAGMSADYSALALTDAEVVKVSAPALSSFARDVLLALGSQREAAESSGVSLATLSYLLGMKSTPEGDREILDALQQLGHLVPGLRYSEADGLVRTGDVHQ